MITVIDNNGNVKTVTYSVGLDATVENSDLTYTATVASGATLVLPDTTYNIYVNAVLDQSFSVPSISNQTINITP